MPDLNPCPSIPETRTGRHAHAFGWIFLVALFACSAGGSETGDADGTTGTPTSGGGDAILADCRAGADEWAKQFEYTCGCAVAAGDYPDVQTCLLNDPPGWWTVYPTCICDVYAAHPENAAYVACSTAVGAALTMCLLPLSCDADALQRGCYDDFAAAMVGCGSRSKPTDLEVELKCYMWPPVTCPSGETILESWVCDSQVDCKDGSDEATCFTCGSGENIPLYKRCDGYYDCGDGSDENDCPPDPGPQDCALGGSVMCRSAEGMGDLPCPPYCTNLRWACDFPAPCAALAVQGGDGSHAVAEVAPAVCAIEAMLAGASSRIDFTLNDAVGELYVVGDGTAMIQWDSECIGDYAYSVRSGRLTLRPDVLEACLVDPTPESLGTCLFGGDMLCFVPTWTPPWSTGEYTTATPPGCVG
jgi:hypothetical protein